MTSAASLLETSSKASTADQRLDAALLPQREAAREGSRSTRARPKSDQKNIAFASAARAADCARSVLAAPLK